MFSVPHTYPTPSTLPKLERCKLLPSHLGECFAEPSLDFWVTLHWSCRLVCQATDNFNDCALGNRHNEDGGAWLSIRCDAQLCPRVKRL